MTSGSPQSQVATQTSKLLALSLPSPLTGFLLELLLARTFGSSSLVDAFRIASLIHLFALNLFFTQLLPHVVVPAFSIVLAQEGAEFAWRALLSVNAIIGYALCVPLLLTLLNPQAVLALLAPGLASQAHAEAALLIGASGISCALIIMSGTLSGALFVHGVFWPNVLSPALLSLSTIAGVLALRYSSPVFGLALGIVTGGLLVAALHIHCARKLSAPRGIRLRHWLVPASQTNLKQFARGFSPLALAAFTGQIVNVLIYRSLTGLTIGTAALYGYAFKLTHVIHMPAATFATVIFPRLAHSHAAADTGGFHDTLGRSARMILFLAIPSAAVWWVLRIPFASALFGGGALSADDLTLIGNLFGILLVAAPMGALTSLITKTCAARHRTGAQLLGAAAGLLLAIALIGPLAAAYGPSGVAAAWVICSTGNLATALLWARLRVGLFSKVRPARFLGSLVLVGATTVLLAALGKQFVLLSPMDGIGPRLLLALLASLALAGALVCSLLIRVREAQDLVGFALSLFQRARSTFAVSPAE